jgi:hypothetical protein
VTAKDFPFFPSGARAGALEFGDFDDDVGSMNTTDEIAELINESAELARRLAGVQRQIDVIYPEVPGEFLEPRNEGVEAGVDDAEAGQLFTL